MSSVLAQLHREQRIQSRFLTEQFEAIDRVQRRLDRLGVQAEPEAVAPAK
jgi:hypothetical protein